VFSLRVEYILAVFSRDGLLRVSLNFFRKLILFAQIAGPQYDRVCLFKFRRFDFICLCIGCYILISCQNCHIHCQNLFNIFYY